MIKDFYIREPKDPNYIFGVLEHSSQVESIIAKIKVLLNTQKGAVLGDMNFGVGIEDLIFETRVNKTELEEEITDQIQQYISEASEFNINPVVSFGRTEGYDYALIDFYINGEKAAGILVK